MLQIQPNLPPGVTFSQLVGVLLFEFALFVLLGILSLLGVKNYRKKQSKLRLLVTGICCTYTAILVLLMLPQTLRLFGFPSTVDELFLDVNKVAVVLTAILFYLFYAEAFIDQPQKKRTVSLIFTLVGVLIIILNFALGTNGTILYVVASLSLTLYVFIKLMWNSRKITHKLPNRLDRASMQLLFITILFLTLSYFMTFTTSAMEQIGILPLYSVFYIISSILGFMPFIAFYVAFFQPPAFKLRFITVEDLPPVNQAIQLATFDDDLPQMSAQELLHGENAFEWWYFDIKSPEGVSVVILFERRDPINHPSHPSLRVEYEQGIKKFRRIQVYPVEEFKFTCDSSTSGDCKIDLGPNSLRIKKGVRDIIAGYEVHVRLEDFEADISFSSPHQGFKPSPDGCYFVNKLNPSMKTHVVFASPRINGQGRVTVNGDRVEIIGEGYHDHPWGTAHLLMTHGTWHWGRLFNDEVTIMFAEVLPSPAFYGKLKFCYLASTGQVTPQVFDAYKITPSFWSKNKMLGLKFPHQLDLANNFSLQTRFTKTLMEVPVYVRSQVNFDFSLEKGTLQTRGDGWVEYFHCPNLLRSLLIWMNKRETIKWRKT